MDWIITKVAELFYDEENAVLYINILENAELTLENAKEHYQQIETVTKGQKHLALIDSGNYYTTSHETLLYTSKKTTFKNRVATAYYNFCTPNKLTADFFKNNYKPEMDLKTFKTKEEALVWWANAKDNLLE
ncbi:MAG: hypothetical protein H0U95_06700 [Bacteroidetes bacterium]|nr:hypothetical protein [Bacteroidota bacterium]